MPNGLSDFNAAFHSVVSPRFLRGPHTDIWLLRFTVAFEKRYVSLHVAA